MIDFYRMRTLMRQVGKAWQQYQDALHSAEPKSPIITDMPHAHGVSNPVERAVLRADDMYGAYHEAFQQLEQMRA